MDYLRTFDIIEKLSCKGSSIILHDFLEVQWFYSNNVWDIWPIIAVSLVFGGAWGGGACSVGLKTRVSVVSDVLNCVM